MARAKASFSASVQASLYGLDRVVEEDHERPLSADGGQVLGEPFQPAGVRVEADADQVQLPQSQEYAPPVTSDHTWVTGESPTMSWLPTVSNTGYRSRPSPPLSP